ncbi:uncharacterized protein TNCV_3285741 [Trichonephila clavipes]|nr:uncharacterized protein TNCV_3285741 [Trichonephila clavipes]
MSFNTSISAGKLEDCKLQRYWLSLQLYLLVCFSDETTFEIFQNKAQFVRRRGEKFHSDCVVETVKHPTKIMIWSVISGKGTGRLHVVKGMMRGKTSTKMSCKIA